ncbi:hypothetical protein ACHAPW_007316 [Verticillium nonalfalfae]
MVNLVLGNFISLLSGFSSGNDIPDDFMSLVSKQSLYFVYIGIARFGCIYIYSTAMTYAALRLGRNLRRDYMRSALRQEISFFDFGSVGSISMQATSNGRLIQSATSEKLGQMIQANATFVAAFIIAFVSQWKLTLILICIVPALILMVGTAGGIDAGIETSILKVYAQAGAFAESSLGNIRAIKAFSLSSRIVDQYTKYLDEARTLGQKKNVLYGLLFAGEYFVMFAGMGLAFWQGITMIARGEVDDIGTVFTAATAASELFSLIDRKSNIDPFDPAGHTIAEVDGSINIRGLSFSYPTRPDITVLDDFSLYIPAGKVTALVGASGSGKSTIIGLLERWYNPSSGEITLNDRPLSALNLQWLRTNMRLVQQEPVLFIGTVFDNISNGLVGTAWEHETRDERLVRIKDAAKTAFAHDFIENLPQGYETRIAGVYPGQALLLGKVMDVFYPELDQSRGNFFALMFFIMAICLLFVYMAMGWVSNHIAQAYGHDVRKRMFAAYLRQDLRFFDRPENTIGALTSRLDSDAQSLFELMGFNVTMIMLSVITVLICSVLSIVVSWKLGLVGVFAGIPPMILGGYIRIRVETKMDADIDAKFSKSASIASESVTAIRTVSSLAIENDVLQRYTDELDTAISEAKLSLVSMMVFFAFTQSVEFFILALGF